MPGLVAVRPIESENVSKSGIIVAQANPNQPERGMVVEVGSGADASLKDKTVVFKKYAPDEVEVDGEKLLIVRNDDLLAVLE